MSSQNNVPPVEMQGFLTTSFHGYVHLVHYFWTVESGAVQSLAKAN